MPAPLSMEFSRQEYWNVLPIPTPEDLSDPESLVKSLVRKLISYKAHGSPLPDSALTTHTHTHTQILNAKGKKTANLEF